MKPRETLEAFDAFLAERGLRLDAVVVGGTALNLLGVVSRPTKDCDILYPQLPDEIGDAAKAFAAVSVPLFVEIDSTTMRLFFVSATASRFEEALIANPRGALN